MRYTPDGPSRNGAKCFNCGAVPQARWEGGECDVYVCGRCATAVLPALIADAVSVRTDVSGVSDHRRHLDAVRAAYWEAVACRMRPNPDAVPAATHGTGTPTDILGMTLWEIRGEAGNDSGGGDEVVWAFTPDEQTPPNPHDAIREATGGRSGWYRVESVKAVGPVSSAFRIGHALHDRPPTAQQVNAAIGTVVGAAGFTPKAFVGTTG